MVTLIHINRTRALRIDDVPEIKIVFVKSSVGILPQKLGIDYFQWWHDIKATREQLTEDLKNS